MLSVDVLVAGAGLAGLTAARALAAAGRSVLVCEAGDGVGGRVRTDVVDGVRLDRGFQLLNPSYPAARRELDLDALQLQTFEAGAMVAHGEGRFVVADPRRSPRDLPADLCIPLGTVREKAALARWALTVGYGPARSVKRRADHSLASELDRRGVDGALRDGILRPFLAGVLGEDELRTSRRFAELIVRSFVRGTPGVPAAGMQAIPDQLAAALPPGTVRLHSPLLSAPEGGRDGARTCDTGGGQVRTRALIVAADPVGAARLLRYPAPRMRALTTFYFLPGHSPARRALLHLDADRRGPVVNAAVLTDAAPSYAPGRTLVAATVLGDRADPATEQQVRAHVATVFGVETADWPLAAAYPIPGGLPDTPPGTPLRRGVRLAPGLFVAGDHRDTASIQGALVSGRRAARAVLAELGAMPPGSRSGGSGR